MEIRFNVNEIVPEVSGFRDALGRFRSGDAIAEQLDRNRRFAESLQGEVAQRMRNHIAFGKRADASTGRLLRATLSPGNRFADRFVVGVGDEDFLDRSQARYWRTFEYGSAAVWRRPFIGTKLRFRKGGDGAGFKSYAGVPFAHGDIPGLRTTRSGRAFIFVTKEIEPADIYGAVFRQGTLTEHGVQNARRLASRVFAEEMLRVAGPGR